MPTNPHSFSPIVLAGKNKISYTVCFNIKYHQATPSDVQQQPPEQMKILSDLPLQPTAKQQVPKLIQKNNFQTQIDFNY